MFRFKKISMFLLIVLIAVQTISGSCSNVFADNGSSFIYGDVNGDGEINSIDLVYLRKYILGSIDEFPIKDGIKAADLDGNGVFNSIDYALLRQYILGVIEDFPVNKSPATPIPLELKNSNIVSFKAFNLPLGTSVGLVSQGAISYEWRIISKPSESNALIDDPSVMDPIFTADTAGDYVIGLTVSNDKVTNDEITLNVKVKEFGATTDDVDENAITEDSLTGYDFNDYIPLSDGWIIVKDKTKSKVVFLNVFTGVHGKEFVVDGTPDKMEIDFERELLLVSLKELNTIAKINLETEEITYIDMNNEIVDIALGEKGIVFVMEAKNSDRVIYVVDIIKEKIKNSISVREKYDSMVYDKNGNNLIAAVFGYSPSNLGRYSYNERTYNLELQQLSRDTGSNGQDLAISADGKHVAFSCAGGNGEGYTIYDIDSSDISKKFGEWEIGAYPRSADFSLDNRYLVASNGKELKMFDVENHSEISVVGKAAGSNDKVSFSRGGKILYDAEAETLRIYKSGIAQAEVEPPQLLKIIPTAYTTGDKTVLKGFRVNLDGSASDLGSGTYLEYKWEIVSKPENSQSVIEGEDLSKASFIPDRAGEYCISLTVFNEAGESEPAFVNLAVQNMSDNTDIIGDIESGYIEGYLPIKPITLPSGWIIAADTKNVIKIINILTEEVVAQYQVSATPNKLSYDFENNRIIASLKSVDKIAVIDVEENSVYYIDTPYSYNGITYGEGDIAFAITEAWTNGYISVIDIKEKEVLNSIKVSIYGSKLIEYDSNYNNLFIAETGSSSSDIIRYSFNEETKELKIEQQIDGGANGIDLSLSKDGKHLVFCCGGGNGDGYTIFDFDATNLEKKFGAFETGAYPTSGAFSSDGNYFIASNGSKLMLFDANNHFLISDIKSDSSLATKDEVVFSRGDNIIYDIVGSRIYYFKNPAY